MSPIICPKCGCNEHLSGYGLAVGPMGAYTLCGGCRTLLEFTPDLDDLPDDAAKRILAGVEKWRMEVWGSTSVETSSARDE